MKTYPNCKINIGLHVLDRRSDGYHNIETIFLPIDLHDELEIVASTEMTFQSEGIAIDGPTDRNLVMRAYRLMKEQYPTQVGNIAVRLTKNIPYGAGLGGGSADAAYTLVMLNQIFGLGVDAPMMRQYAAQIGADCPFFIENRPAYATGIGEQLQSIELDLQSYQIVVIKPAEGVNTAEAYQRLHALRQTEATIDRETIKRAYSQYRERAMGGERSLVTTLLQQLDNDFEAAIFPNHPTIGHIKEQMNKAGAVYAAMSGSGSAVYGFFEKGSQPKIALPDGSQRYDTRVMRQTPTVY